MTGKIKDELSSRPPVLFLKNEDCRGCTHCLRVCPTEAIRIRRGRAEIMPHRCIHCGECIRACPWKAWSAAPGYAWAQENASCSRAVLDPSVFGQFGGRTSPPGILQAFLKLGIASVYSMGESLEVYRRAVSHFLASEGRPFPAISSDCPAVVQFLQVKFPSLLENLVPVVPYYEIAANRRKGDPPKDGGGELFYVVPCPAKALAAREPRTPEGRYPGALPLSQVYSAVKSFLSGEGGDRGEKAPGEGPYGLEWAFPGGESRGVGMAVSLTVEGIHRVAEVLDLAESGRLEEVPFIEAWACTGGCLGGPWNVQNPAWARFHLSSQIQKYASPLEGTKSAAGQGNYFCPPPALRKGMRLDENLPSALEKLRRIDEVVKKFPGIDCGSCGCPNCLALAEDVVQGLAVEDDCLYILKAGRKPRRRGKKGS